MKKPRQKLIKCGLSARNFKLLKIAKTETMTKTFISKSTFIPTKSIEEEEEEPDEEASDVAVAVVVAAAAVEAFSVISKVL